MEAASQNNPANAANPANFAVRGGRRRSRRLPLAQLLFAVAGIVLLVTAGTYFLRFVSATAFHKERAFRVLDEFGSQLDNLQRTLANQLELAADRVGRWAMCAGVFRAGAAEPVVRRSTRQLSAPPGSAGTQGRHRQRRQELVCSRLRTNESVTARLLQAREPGVPFTTFSCAINCHRAARARS